MSILRNVNKHNITATLAAVGLASGVLAAQPAGYAMGWLEKKLSGEEFWEKERRAMPFVKARADQVLSQLGYDPTHLVGQAYLEGGGDRLGGDEIWLVQYWHAAPAEYSDMVKAADLEAYLNSRGVVRRVMKFEHHTEQLLYGKDERIEHGMTPDQVRERLGEPDYQGAPPRYLKRGIVDTMWKYNRNADRTMEIHVYFKAGKVASASYFGK